MVDQVSASHILLMYKGSTNSSNDRSEDEAKDKIKMLRSQVEEGTNFGELAREFSDCPSGTQGGDLGSFGRGQMVPEFENAVFNMEIGDLSEIIKTDFGYHIIQRTG
ncbi:MAG: parvulin peptidyl-prolyl isomerase [Rhodospirillaceae bacterium]|nr:parvulin peptidyl-prolyl isomerase [Rhodospirillaceae bacterium]